MRVNIAPQPLGDLGKNKSAKKAAKAAKKAAGTLRTDLSLPTEQLYAATVQDLIRRTTGKGLAKGALKQEAVEIKDAVGAKGAKPLERRENVYKALSREVASELQRETDPARRAKLLVVQKKLKKETKNLKDELKGSIGDRVVKDVKKALPVAAVVAAFVPGLQAFAPMLKAAAAVNTAYDKKKELDDAKDQRHQEKKAIKATEQKRTEFVGTLTRQGVPAPQARQILQLVESGQDVQSAYQQVMATMPPTTGGPSLSEGESMQQFVEWVKQWKPELYDAAMAEAQANSSTMSGVDDSVFGVDMSLSGLLDSFLDTVQTVAAKVLPAVYEKKMLDIQLDRAKKGLAPLPTATAQQQAIAQTQTQQAASSGSSGTILGVPTGTALLVGAAGLAAYFFFGRGRGRRRR